MASPDLRRISFPKLHVGALQTNNERNAQLNLLRGGDHAFGDDVTLHDSAEYIDEDRFHVRGRQNQLERRRHLLFVRSAAYVQEVGGAPPTSLMVSMVAMANPAPFTMQPMSPSKEMYARSNSFALASTGSSSSMSRYSWISRWR